MTIRKCNFHSLCNSSRQVISFPHLLLYKRENCNREERSCFWNRMKVFFCKKLHCVLVNPVTSPFFLSSRTSISLFCSPSLLSLSPIICQRITKELYYPLAIQEHRLHLQIRYSSSLFSQWLGVQSRIQLSNIDCLILSILFPVSIIWDISKRLIPILLIFIPISFPIL